MFTLYPTEWTYSVKHFTQVHKQTHTFTGQTTWKYIYCLLLIRIRDPPDGIKEVSDCTGSCQLPETQNPTNKQPRFPTQTNWNSPGWIRFTMVKWLLQIKQILFLSCSDVVQSNSNRTLQDSFAQRLSWLYIQYKPHSVVVSWYCLHPNEHMSPLNKWRSKLHGNERPEELEHKKACFSTKDKVTKLHLQCTLEACLLFLWTTQLIFHDLFGISFNGCLKTCMMVLPNNFLSMHRIDT